MNLAVQQSVQKTKRIFVVLLLVMVGLFFFAPKTEAAGLIEEVESNGYEYSKYPDENYQLDYDKSDDGWLADKINSAIAMLMDGIWYIARVIANFTGYLVKEAYELDFIKQFSGKIGRNIQILAGVDSSGLHSGGLIYGFLKWIILIVGVYIACHVLIKRSTSKAIGGGVNLIVVFVLTVCLIGYAPSYIEKVAEFSSEVNTTMLSVSNKLVFASSGSGGGRAGVSDSSLSDIDYEDDTSTESETELIVNSIWGMLVKQPWLILQFGTTDVSDERLESIVSLSPDDDDREDVIKKEVTDNGNTTLKSSNLGNRFGAVVLILIVDIVIAIFVMLLIGTMLFSEFLFLIFAMMLPFVFVFGMLPGQGGRVLKTTLKLFNILMVRTAISVIVTIAFGLSSAVYSLSSSTPFLFIAFLQILIFVGVYANINSILRLFSLDISDSQRGSKGMVHGVRRFPDRVRHAVLQVTSPYRTIASAVSGSRRTKQASSQNGNSQSKDNSQNEQSQNGQGNANDYRTPAKEFGKTIGRISDIPKNIKDNAAMKKDKIKNAPMHAAHAAYSAKEGFKQARKENQSNRDCAKEGYQERARKEKADLMQDRSKKKGDTYRPEKPNTQGLSVAMIKCRKVAIKKSMF